MLGERRFQWTKQGGGRAEEREVSLPLLTPFFFFAASFATPPPPPQELPDTQAIWGRILKSSFLLSFFSGSNDCYITKS